MYAILKIIEMISLEVEADLIMPGTFSTPSEKIHFLHDEIKVLAPPEASVSELKLAILNHIADTFSFSLVCIDPSANNFGRGVATDYYLKNRK